MPSRPSAGGDVNGLEGHRNRQWNRDVGFGSVTFTQIPDKGMTNHSPSQSKFSKPFDGGDNRSGNSTGHLPKLNFLEFSGDNPKLWITRCESYFEMYEVEEFRWIQIASMYLSDAAARWFQSVQHMLKHAS